MSKNCDSDIYFCPKIVNLCIKKGPHFVCKIITCGIVFFVVVKSLMFVVKLLLLDVLDDCWFWWWNVGVKGGLVWASPGLYLWGGVIMLQYCPHQVTQYFYELHQCKSDCLTLPAVKLNIILNPGQSYWGTSPSPSPSIRPLIGGAAEGAFMVPLLFPAVKQTTICIPEMDFHVSVFVLGHGYVTAVNGPQRGGFTCSDLSVCFCIYRTIRDECCWRRFNHIPQVVY